MEIILQELITQIKRQSEELTELRSQLQSIEISQQFPDWIPRKTVMQFLNYGDTQMAALLKQGELVVCAVGARKFIEKRSFLKFMEKNIQ